MQLTYPMIIQYFIIQQMHGKRFLFVRKGAIEENALVAGLRIIIVCRTAGIW